MRSKPLAIGVIGVVIGVLLSTAVVLAGNPSPPAGPGEPGSQMFTLQTIYDRLAYGAAGSTAPAFTEPSAAPGGTMHTLGDIMDAAPAPDAANGATAAHVAAGKTFWGLTAGEWGLQTGTASGGDTTYLAGVPKSGQTTLYATGDDGDLEKGVALPNGQGGGTVPPAPNPRFTNNGNGTVRDNLTGLIWLQNATCLGQQDWATALSAANTLNSGECDLTDGSVAGDWRLPNVRELPSLFDYGQVDPALPNGHPFTAVNLGEHYWTSTTYVADPSIAWMGYLGTGHVYGASKTGYLNVWAVRGGP
jgi:hypothetical protein